MVKTKPQVKVNVSLDGEVLDQVLSERVRQERSASWLLQQAWQRSRKTVSKFPSGRKDRALKVVK